jgi:hypothetical protein
MKESILVTVIIFLLILSYAAIGGVAAAWFNTLSPNHNPGSEVYVGAMWPISVPVLVGVQVYTTIEAEQ